MGEHRRPSVPYPDPDEGPHILPIPDPDPSPVSPPVPRRQSTPATVPVSPPDDKVDALEHRLRTVESTMAAFPDSHLDELSARVAALEQTVAVLEWAVMPVLTALQPIRDALGARTFFYNTLYAFAKRQQGNTVGPFSDFVEFLATETPMPALPGEEE